MTVTLLSLPMELQLRIFTFLDGNPNESYNNFVHWSSTCSFYRANLAPFVFRTLDLRNTEKSGRSIRTLVNGPYKKHVRKVQYKGRLYCDDHNDVEGFEDDEEVAKARAEMDVPRGLLDEVQAVLADLKAFPSLSSLTVEFEFDGTYFLEEQGYPYTDLLYRIEDENPKAIEAVRPWRSLMARSFDAIANNTASSIKHFEIKELIAKPVSTYTEPHFHQFLAGLESFKLAIKGGENAAGWCVNTCEGYHQTLSQLHEYFFKHLTSLVDLSIHCSSRGPLGLYGENHIPLHLLGQAPIPPPPSALLSLKSLSLNTCFIEPELNDFLCARAATLESVVLENCYASSENAMTLAENPATWAHLFANARRLTKLRRFEILPADAPLTQKETYPDVEIEEDEPDEVLQARKTIETDSSRRLFSYAYLDDKYGMLFEDEESNLESFLLGEDQKAYDLLMADVRSRASSSH